MAAKETTESWRVGTRVVKPIVAVNKIVIVKIVIVWISLSVEDRWLS
jgi:hypothetical protein